MSGTEEMTQNTYVLKYYKQSSLFMLQLMITVFMGSMLSASIKILSRARQGRDVYGMDVPMNPHLQFDPQKYPYVAGANVAVDLLEGNLNKKSKYYEDQKLWMSELMKALSNLKTPFMMVLSFFGAYRTRGDKRVNYFYRKTYSYFGDYASDCFIMSWVWAREFTFKSCVVGRDVLDKLGLHTDGSCKTTKDLEILGSFSAAASLFVDAFKDSKKFFRYLHVLSVDPNKGWFSWLAYQLVRLPIFLICIVYLVMRIIMRLLPLYAIYFLSSSLLLICFCSAIAGMIGFVAEIFGGNNFVAKLCIPLTIIVMIIPCVVIFMIQLFYMLYVFIGTAIFARNAPNGLKDTIQLYLNKYFSWIVVSFIGINAIYSFVNVNAGLGTQSMIFIKNFVFDAVMLTAFGSFISIFIKI